MRSALEAGEEIKVVSHPHPTFECHWHQLTIIKERGEASGSYVGLRLIYPLMFNRS